MTRQHDGVPSVPKAALLLLAGILMGGLITPGALANGEQAAETGPPNVRLFVSGDAVGRTYLPLNSVTLTETAAPVLDFGASYPSWALSEDGSTFVRVEERSGGVTVHVYDGLGGAERFSFQPSVRAFGPTLSADGSKVVLFGGQNGSDSGVSAPSYYAFETDTGHQLSAIEGEGQGIGPYGFHRPLIDRAAQRLYLPYAEQGGLGEGPWPLQIAAYDLTTGERVKQSVFPEIPAGSWFGERVEQVPVNQLVTPGIALSPDGERLAIVHADTEAVTTVDAETLAVTGTHALTQPTGLLDRVVGWFAPQGAEAKFLEGREVSAIFASDGRHLYIFGREGTVGNAIEEVEETGLGVKMVDVQSGDVVAEALGGELIEEIRIVPGGETIYAIGPSEPWVMAEGTPATVVRRLDAESLEVLAEREFGGQQGFLLLPESAVATLPDPGRAADSTVEEPVQRASWSDRPSFSGSLNARCSVQVAGA